MWISFLKSTTLCICTLIAEGQDDGDLRLVNGSNSREGRLEIFHSGIWGSVCNNNFHYPDASVACRQLGFRCLSDVQIYTQGGYTTKIWMDKVSCNGLETSLKTCSHNGWGSHNCRTGENVGIRCFGGCEGDLMLVGGSDSGLLNIFHSGSWGTICNDAFGSEDALVVCKQLKMRTTDVQYYTAGTGTGNIWLDDVACNGQENRLDYCSHRGWNVHNCRHSKDVGVRCYGGYGSVEGDLRLVDGNNHEEGRLEIYYNSKWGTVCDDYFDSSDAVVACRQLGYRTSNATVYTSGGGTDPVWLDDMACNGTERRIANCRNPGWGTENCAHTEDVGVRCRGEYGVNGNWGYWASWSSCNFTCGSGTRKRTRRCDTPFPSFGGSFCTGKSTESQTCAGSSCPVNGNWGSWADWTICSSSCKSGFQTRYRLCNNPLPSLNGAYCNGRSFEVLNCSIAMCTVDGDWSEWSFWSICSATCNGGIQERNRECDAPTPSNGGLYCNGTTIKSRPCNNIFCEIHGQWGQWQEWDSCNTTCGNGFKNRSRTCDSPYPMFDGSDCIGPDFDIQICYNDICPGAQQQKKEDASNSFPAEFVGGVAVGCIVITAVIIFISLFIFRRFNPGKVAKRKRNECSNEGLSQLRITSQPNDYECTGRSIGTQSGVYDTCSNTEVAIAHTQCNVDNIEVATTHTQCNVDNIDRGAYANTQFNADNNEEVYENLKVQ